MPMLRDPYNRERTHLTYAVDLTNKRVLEIGCGSGRLTMSYQHPVDYVVGIDVSADILKTASASWQGKADFAMSDALHLPFRDKSFDVAIFSWSL